MTTSGVRFRPPPKTLDHMIWRAQIILEHDTVFSRNLESLRHRIKERKVPESAWKKIRNFLAADCLRRHNVIKEQAELVLRHGA